MKTKLRFEEICPKWNYAIKQGHRPPNTRRKMDLTLSSACVVGEAYGWNDGYEPGGRYYCDDCSDFGLAFTNTIGVWKTVNGEEVFIPYAVSKKNLKDYNSTKKEFEKHWNSRHLKS